MMINRFHETSDAFSDIVKAIEHQDIYQQMTKHKGQPVMLAQYIMEKGFKEGLQQGIQQVVQQGVQQGIQKGFLLNSRESVIDVLEARFGVIPKSIINKINKIEETSVLKMLLRKAGTAASLTEFKEVLAGGRGRATLTT